MLQGSVLFVSTSTIFSQTVLQRDIFDFLFSNYQPIFSTVIFNMLSGKIDMVQVTLRGTTLYPSSVILLLWAAVHPAAWVIFKKGLLFLKHSSGCLCPKKKSWIPYPALQELSWVPLALSLEKLEQDSGWYFLLCTIIKHESCFSPRVKMVLWSDTFLSKKKSVVMLDKQKEALDTKKNTFWPEITCKVL